MVWAASTVLTLGAIGAGTAATLYSSSKASNAQEQAAQQANNTQQAMYDQTRSDNMPWHDAGVNALSQLSAGTQPGGQFMQKFGVNDFHQDPGYAFRLQQGQDALDNSAASRGGLLSGAQIKASTDYNQNFASNEYGNAYNRFNNDQTNQFNRLSSVAGTGQTANNTIGQVGMNTANQISNNTTGAGNARASGYMGASNAINSAIGMGFNQYNQNNALSNMNTFNSPNNWGGGYNANGSFSPNTYGTGQSPYAGSNALANGGWGIE